MKIDSLKCQKCAKCIPFCPVGAISVKGKNVIIEVDECVECGVCARSGICQDGAFVREELVWPRILRAEFSDPTIPHKKTDIAGRGTAEMKTNDVSGRIKRGEVGVAVELGRPGGGNPFHRGGESYARGGPAQDPPGRSKPGKRIGASVLSRK